MDVRSTIFAVIALGVSVTAKAQTCPSYPYALVNGSIAYADQVMGNFNSILTCTDGLFATPPPLGSTTPNSVAASSISDTGAINMTGGPITWNGDTGISRLSSGTLGIGHGSAGDISGAVVLANLCIQGNVNITQITTGLMQIGSGCGYGSGGTIILTGIQASGSVIFSGLTTGSNADFLCLGSGGQVYIQASACTISSARFKQNVEPWSDAAALSDVMALTPVTFTLVGGDRNPDKNAALPQHGLIAEQVASVDPKLAVYEPDMTIPKSYRQEAIIAALIGAVRAQQEEIDVLKARLTNLQALVSQ